MDSINFLLKSIEVENCDEIADFHLFIGNELLLFNEHQKRKIKQRSTLGFILKAAWKYLPFDDSCEDIS